MARKALLACGILSSLLYAGMNLFVPMLWEGYNLAAQAVSELSAIGAPTRALWVPLGTLYELLIVAFAFGIWISSHRNRPLRTAAGLMLAYGVFGFFWPPMHSREVLAAGGKTLTDTLHLVWAAGTVLLMFLAIGFGAAALGKGFRLYSIATIVLLLGFGALAGRDAPRVEANLPTPWMGVWERINIGVFLLWVAVLSLVLMRGEGQEGTRAERE